MLGEKIDVNGISIHYEKIGSGSKTLLLLPGGLGTTRTDFGLQLEESGLNRKEFTIIAWDPPGYGYSRPPERQYSINLFESDGDIAHALMKKLGYNTYSVLGWSDGGKTALFMAIKYQSSIDRAIVWGVALYYNPEASVAFKATKSMSNWDKNMLAEFRKFYGAELEKLWTKHCDFFYDYYPRDHVIIAPDQLRKIRCPVLVMHGDQDPLVPYEFAKYVMENIPDSRLYRFPKGSHNMHIQFPDIFKRVAQDFLNEDIQEM